MTQQPPWPAGPPPRGERLPYGSQPYGSLSGPYEPQPTRRDDHYAAAQQPVGQQPAGQQPSAPLVPQAPQAVHIEDFEPPKTPKRVIALAVAAALLVGALALAAFLVLPKPGPTPGPTASPATPVTTPTTPRPTSTGTANGIDFESTDGIRGHWEVLSEEWSGNTVTLQLKIDVREGTLPYQFFAFDNAVGNPVNPTSPRKQPGLTTGRINAGESATGYVSFAMPRRGPGTVYLASNSRNSLAALRIKG